MIVSHVLYISAAKGWEIVLVARSKDKLDQVKRKDDNVFINIFLRSSKRLRQLEEQL